MKKIDPIIWKETRYIAMWVLILSALMEAVFLVIGRWDVTVLFGNLLGGGMAILNFLLMGLTVQSALGKEEKEAKQALRASMALRSVLVFVVVAVGVLLPVFSNWTVILPLFFNRVAIALRPAFSKRMDGAVTQEIPQNKEDAHEE